MGPRFDKIALLPDGKLLVEGPFETHGEVVDDVVVRFAIAADAIPRERFGIAILHKSSLATSGTAADLISRGRFSGTVSGSGLAVGNTVRAIGLSVAPKRADSPDPSAFETFTWCVRFDVTGDDTPDA
jgi:hypothetical protein